MILLPQPFCEKKLVLLRATVTATKKLRDMFISGNVALRDDSCNLCRTSPRVSSYFYFRATRILLQFCPRDMSHEVQLVELCGTCCRDKTLQGCDVPSYALLCNAFIQQNQHFSQSQTTTRIFRALSLGKKQLRGHG